MAKKISSQGEYRNILTSIRKGVFAPVYLLMGEETFYIDKLIDILESSVIKDEEAKEFNYTTFYGQDADIGTVIATCQQYPFMSDYRMVLLKEAQSMNRSKSVLENLAPYIERPNPKCVFVLSFKGDNLNSTSALMKAASKSGAVIFKSPALKEWELSAPITEYCREKKIGIGEDAINMLVEYVGNELSKVFGAIDKLVATGELDNFRITTELIQRNIGISKEYNNFELQSALASKNYEKCLRIIKYFQSNPKKNPTSMTTGMLFGFYSKLLIAQLSGEKNENAIMSLIGAKSSYAFRDYRTGLQKYSIAQTVNAIHQLRQFDIRSKGVGSFQNEYSLLIEMIFNIFTGRGN
ncbi:MAG: DNA polymerase III subunit delta [Muribaculaceae bacterium]|nr:DNA polymerase III subunit delta [Muribaculaceae bacterium]